MPGSAQAQAAWPIWSQSSRALMVLAKQGLITDEECAAIVEGLSEIEAEIDPGKTLEIRLQAVGETTEEGDARVFFELNGQPRVIRVPNRAIKAKTAAKPKAQEGNPNHIGAPMPGCCSLAPACFR